jgi:hypothetical protein
MHNFIEMIKNIFICLAFFCASALNAQFKEQKIVPADIDPGDFFGRYLAIQQNDLLIGAHQDDVNGYASGALYIFSKTAGEDQFREVEKIVPDDGDVEEFFGYSIDISGQWAVVGSHHDSDYGGSSGSAFILKHNGTRWQIDRKLLPGDPKAGDEYGKAARISGNTIAIGCFLDDDQGTNSGSVYLYSLTDDHWIEIEEIYPDDPEKYDQFGNFLSIDQEILAVGVPEKQDNGPKSGCAYIFERSGDHKWLQTAKLIPGDISEGDEFGQAINIHNEKMVVGAYKHDGLHEDGGAVYVFVKNGDAWEQVQKIISPDNEEGDHFGNAVYQNGKLLVAGAYFDDDNGSKSGSVYLYKWVNDSYQFLTKLVSSDGGFGDAFGSAVAIDSNYLVVGAYADSDNGFFSGSAYVYEISEILAISSHQTDKPLVYPTIFSSYLHISLENVGSTAQIELIDLNGRTVKTWNQRVNEQRIMLNSVQPGWYVLRILQNNRTSFFQLLKPDH